MSKILIDGKKFELIKRGRAQAVQVYGLGQWLNHYGNFLVAIFAEKPEELGMADGISFLGNIIGSIEPDAMLDLYEIVLGCTSEFSEKNFDIADLVEAVVTVYNEHPTIRRLVDRFFSTDNLSEEQAEDSTPSDPLMDGQTIKS
jgi:hypothetical protein